MRNAIRYHLAKLPKLALLPVLEILILASQSYILIRQTDILENTLHFENSKFSLETRPYAYFDNVLQLDKKRYLSATLYNPSKTPVAGKLSMASKLTFMDDYDVFPIANIVMFPGEKAKTIPFEFTTLEDRRKERDENGGNTLFNITRKQNEQFEEEMNKRDPERKERLLEMMRNYDVILIFEYQDLFQASTTPAQTYKFTQKFNLRYNSGVVEKLLPKEINLE